MAFVQAMNTTKVGVNGANVYTEEGVGDYRVTLFTMLNRGLGADYIKDSIEKISKSSLEDGMRDMFVMAFQTRDIRGGKGERQLFINFIRALYEIDKSTLVKCLPLIPEYGCWRDMWDILKLIPELENDIFSIVQTVYEEDTEKSQSVDQKNKMSLLAKWLPREKSKTYPELGKKLASYLYRSEPSFRKRLVLYRTNVSFMNKTLKTVEINMCGGTWREITPEHVPGRNLKLHTKAFLNQKLKSDTLRFPDSEDRMVCRQHFTEFIEGLKKGEKKAHGANVVMPHELIVTALNGIRARTVADNEMAIIQGQWDSIREETLKLGGLGKCVPMCDFSGSMNGIPKYVSLALGILISEINHSAFRDHILSFDADPEWHSFAGKTTLKEKLNSISSDLAQGLNTDFFKACMCILDRMKKCRVPVGEEPEDLIVLTDMGFDAASKENSYYGRSSTRTQGTWETQIQQIREEFKAVGEEVWGVGNGWKAPRIVIWNLRAEYKDFHAKADEEGVVQLSGWSPSILKALQKGGVQVMTPYQGMRIILDDERYDPVRKIWNEAHNRT